MDVGGSAETSEEDSNDGEQERDMERTIEELDEGDEGDIDMDIKDIDDVEADSANGHAIIGQEEREPFLVPRNVAEVLAEAKWTRIRRPKEIYLKNFYKILLLIALFYGLPSVQFVFFQYQQKESTGIYCYYNFKCQKPFLGFEAFNNIVSNAAYVVFGALFIIFVKLTRPQRNAKLGLHTDMSLYYSIGLCVMLEGIFSALYHVCPSRINFQFDTTFMILGTTFLFITLFQKRHPTAVPGAIRTFICLALIVLTNFISLIDIPIELFWAWVAVLTLGICVPVGVQVYYRRKVPLRYLLQPSWSRFWPIAAPGRLLMVILCNAIALGLLAFAAKTSIQADQTQDFPTLVLAIVVAHTLMYIIYYVACKIYYKERISALVYILFVLIFGFWGSGLYFFETGPTNKFLTPDESKALNQPCLLFDYFDSHDLWHFLSAGGLLSIGLAVYLLDYGIRQTPRAELAVF